MSAGAGTSSQLRQTATYKRLLERRTTRITYIACKLDTYNRSIKYNVCSTSVQVGCTTRQRTMRIDPSPRPLAASCTLRPKINRLLPLSWPHTASGRIR